MLSTFSSEQEARQTWNLGARLSEAISQVDECSKSRYEVKLSGVGSFEPGDKRELEGLHCVIRCNEKTEAAVTRSR
eukprot:4274486-Amphidinium_carterae.2